MKYKVIKSDRQSLGLEVEAGIVTVRAPRKARRREIRAFVRENRAWIRQKLKEFPKKIKGRKLSDNDINDLIERAKVVIPPRVKHYAAMIGVSYNRITVRHQKTRWGSCSNRQNLNFNCLLMLMPTEVMDSVIVHELCHLKHMNHSKEFYDEVYRLCPNYNACNQWLKQNGKDLVRRMTHK